MVKALCYKLAGHRFDESATCHGGKLSLGDDSADVLVLS
jgi:hypothetical protein